MHKARFNRALCIDYSAVMRLWIFSPQCGLFFLLEVVVVDLDCGDDGRRHGCYEVGDDQWPVYRVAAEALEHKEE